MSQVVACICGSKLWCKALGSEKVVCYKCGIPAPVIQQEETRPRMLSSCPKCSSQSVEYNIAGDRLECMFSDCGWHNGQITERLEEKASLSQVNTRQLLKKAAKHTRKLGEILSELRDRAEQDVDWN